MLGNFNKTVLMVASVLLILGLIIIGLFISKNIEKSDFPPIISDCPDYWNVVYDNTFVVDSNLNTNQKISCRNNSINSGRNVDSCRTYNANAFNSAGTTAADKICAKYRWAKSCDIHWDGISNNSQACANTTI